MRKAVLVLGDGSIVRLEGRFIVISEANQSRGRGLGDVVEYRDGVERGVSCICDDAVGVLEVLTGVLQKVRRKKES